jgi:hypothetical protein
MVRMRFEAAHLGPPSPSSITPATRSAVGRFGSDPFQERGIGQIEAL